MDYFELFEDLFDSSAGVAAGASILAGVLSIALIVALIAIAFYVFNALMLYKLAQKRGVENAWLAWIPYGNMWILGKVSGPMVLFGKWKIEKPELILLLAPIALMVIGWILGVFAIVPFIGLLFAAISTVISWVGDIAYAIFRSLALYRIYSAYVPKKTTLTYSILDIFFFSLTTPFFFASILKKDAISEGYDFTF